MKRSIIVFYIWVIFVFSGPKIAFAECRFWAAIGESIPNQLINTHLLKMPQSLKILGEEYDDGWSVGIYDGENAMVKRGSKAAHQDPLFDRSVGLFAQREPAILVSHLRKASSGCVDGVSNPHPFVRVKGKVNWLFGHNGTIAKSILIELIGEDYLESNPPMVCSFDPPESWIDSELFFIFLLKNIDENQGNVAAGLESGLKQLYQSLGDERIALNFFLTNGENIWAFRKGPTLFYFTQDEPRLSIVSSTPPIASDDWQDVGEDTFIIMSQDREPELVPLFQD